VSALPHCIETPAGGTRHTNSILAGCILVPPQIFYLNFQFRSLAFYYPLGRELPGPLLFPRTLRPTKFFLFWGMVSLFSFGPCLVSGVFFFLVSLSFYDSPDHKSFPLSVRPEVCLLAHRKIRFRPCKLPPDSTSFNTQLVESVPPSPLLKTPTPSSSVHIGFWRPEVKPLGKVTHESQFWSLPSFPRHRNPPGRRFLCANGGAPCFSPLSTCGV